MKQLTLTAALATLSFGTLTAQNTFPASGNAGVGITTPNFHLQLHGTTSYSELDKFGASVNYGVTSRLGFTNTTTGSTANDGLLMRMSTTNFVMHNKENGGITLQTNGALFNLSGSNNRITLGPAVGATSEYGYANVAALADNGLYIYTQTAGKYGLSVRSATLTDEAIKVVGVNGTANTFLVKASGETSILNTNISPTAGAFSVKSSTQDLFKVNGNGSVLVNYSGATNDNILVVQNSTQKLLQLSNTGLLRLRKVRVDSETWADYVFDENYNLMPLSDVKQYIDEHNHLPDVPSASEVEEEGIDLAEMNKILLQKVEELTLYVIQQQEEIEALKEAVK